LPKPRAADFKQLQAEPSTRASTPYIAA
jgi:hypothetical protein